MAKGRRGMRRARGTINVPYKRIKDLFLKCQKENRFIDYKDITALKEKVKE